MDDRTVGSRQVDAFIEDKLLARDPALEAALRANAEAGLPAIDVSPAQGKQLQLLARMTGARRILEVGTLGGYSTIWLARGLPEGGQVVTLELEPHHAEVAAANIAAAGLTARVDIRIGPAIATLDAMVAAGEAPFDLVFVDADKPSNPAYLRAALALSRPGTVLVFDNVVRDGTVLDADSADPSVQGTRALYDAIAAERRVDATAIQTLGAKGWDGFLIGIVDA
ncbi:O-methyltransferase [Sphingomonas sp. UNC305MFCol5.2]|uniref:O-methyltransferase n=1 Tax=Sphingomonas sp. UNC305MFCol5.2 TaxID=1449076 RepID=UPI0004A3F66C|nr:O-methyltransferase [Sphingomonas sp. UNC305MFCol5.2]